MTEKSCSAVVMLAALVIVVVACIGFLVMTIVFCYVPALTYTDVIFNVNNTRNDTFTLNVRCDYGSNAANLNQIVTDCGAASWITQPVCGPYYDWLMRPFSFGSIACPSRSLAAITATRDTNISWIGLAFGLSLIGFIIFLIPTACLVHVCCTK